jgi:hypothetical protein
MEELLKDGRSSGSEELGGWVRRFDTDADTDTDADADSGSDLVGRRHPSQKPV